MSRRKEFQKALKREVENRGNKNNKRNREYLAIFLSVLFFLSILQASVSHDPYLLESNKSAKTEPFLNTEDGIGPVVSGSLTAIGQKIFQFTSSGGQAQIIQHVNGFYNTTYDTMFYVVCTSVNAYNGANIESGGAGGAKSSIYNIMQNEGYNYTKCVETGGHCKIFIIDGHEVKIWVPTYTSETESPNSGFLEAPTPSGYEPQGTQGTITQGIGVEASISGGVSFFGISGSVSSSALYYITTTYNIPIMTVNVIHANQYCFGSYQQYYAGGNTYDSFTSMIATNFTPGYTQHISITSGANVTWSTYFLGFPTLHMESVKETSLYASKNVIS